MGLGEREKHAGQSHKGGSSAEGTSYIDSVPKGLTYLHQKLGKPNHTRSLLSTQTFVHPSIQQVLNGAMLHPGLIPGHRKILDFEQLRLKNKYLSMVPVQTRLCPLTH